MRRRVVVLSDVSIEPDDQQSLGRYLTYANEFDIEGIIATTSSWRKSNPDKATVLEVIEAYELALPKLRRHANGFPDADTLRSITKSGVDGYGMKSAEEQSENEGVRQVISVLDRDDPRPGWFSTFNRKVH